MASLYTNLLNFDRAHHAWSVGDQTPRDLNALEDACVALGMPRDEPSVQAWAARRVAAMDWSDRDGDENDPDFWATTYRQPRGGFSL